MHHFNLQTDRGIYFSFDPPGRAGGGAEIWPNTMLGEKYDSKGKEKGWNW